MTDDNWKYIGVDYGSGAYDSEKDAQHSLSLLKSMYPENEFKIVEKNSKWSVYGKNFDTSRKKSKSKPKTRKCKCK